MFNFPKKKNRLLFKKFSHRCLLSTLIIALTFLSNQLAISATENTPTFPKESEHFILEIDDKYLTKVSPQNLQKWLEQLDRVYDAMKDFVGNEPCKNTEKIKIKAEENPTIWGIAYVGCNLVGWGTGYIPGEMEKINNGFMPCGIVHEIGHLFDLDYRWTFDEEACANLKVSYIIDTMTDIKFDWNGEKLSNENLKNFYKSVTGSSFDKKLGNPTEPCYSDDSLVYKFLLIKERYGWDVFKTVFRNFYEFPREGYKDEQRFAWFAKYLIKTLNKIHNDVDTMIKIGEKICTLKCTGLNYTTHWWPLTKIRNNAETAIKIFEKLQLSEYEVLDDTTYSRSFACSLKSFFLFAKFLKYCIFDLKNINLKNIDITDPSLNQFLSSAKQARSKQAHLTPIFSKEEFKILKDKFNF